MKWHPFAEKFGWIDQAEWPSFLESIKSTGGNEEPIRYRMVDGKKQGLDGRNRERACEELGVSCKAVEVQVGDADVKAWIIRQNVHRRHMSQEARRAIVTDLRADGQSTRQIADTLGVDHSTVVRDIAATGAAAPVDKVTGKDGKSRPATRRRTDNSQCQPDAPDDEQRHPDDDAPDMTPEANGEHADPEPDADAPRLDRIGVRIPDHLLDAFDPAHEELRQTLLTHCRQLREGLHRYAESDAGVQLRKRLSREVKGEQGARYRSKELQALFSLVDHWSPHSCTCPYCHHKGGLKKDCPACLGSGWVCKDAYDGAPADYREAVELLREEVSCD